MSEAKPNILIVDDEQINLKLLKAHLMVHGYDILEAVNGHAALVAVEQLPDLILLDIMMPGMDGFETCRRLKARKAVRDIPIIFMSARHDTDTKLKCFGMGGVDYVGKPVEVPELLARVRTHLTLRQQEIQLNNYTKKLEQTVKDKAKQLFWVDQLANLGKMGAAIAHEIRNPLSGINVLLDGIDENIENTERSHDIRQLLAEAKKATHKIESVVKKVLDFSKFGDAQLVLTVINRPVKEALTLSRNALRGADIRIEEQLEENLPHLYLDEQLLEQVVLNLINNAVAAMKNNTTPKILKIATTVQNENVYVTVADSGPGIPVDIKYRVFDPFFTTKSDGSGIGLSLCHRIISQHGGTIETVPSELGGAAIRIQIPVEKRSDVR